MKNSFFLVILAPLLACNSVTRVDELPRHIGIIEYDPKIDTIEFEVCNEESVYPYFHHKGLSYEGEKPAMVSSYERLFRPSDEQESGYITIRFIVNCKGEAGRFRMIQMDKNYELKKFSDEMPMQLYDITKSLEGWDVLERDNKSYDYVRYLTFKINNGVLKDIMP